MTTPAKASNAILHVTVNGLERLSCQLMEIEARYRDICDQRRVAHELSGDGWHDNPEFNRLQQMEAFLNGEIKRLLADTERARVFTVSDGHRPLDRVWLGSVVTLELVDDENGDIARETWEITGHGDSNARSGMLAYDAPLAAAVLTLEPGDWAEEVLLRGRSVSVQVLALHARRTEGFHGG